MEVIMNEGTQAPQAPARKGLPTIAWIGIGCGALIVVMLLVFTVGGFLMARKVKQVAGDLDFEENPALATARMIVRLNPELEEVATDKEKGTITVRNTKTGEEITVNFDEIKEGRLSFSTGDREVTIDASDVGESGSINISDDKDTFVISTGDAGGQEIPPWVPVYPGTEPTSRHSMHADETLSGGFQIETTERVDQLVEFYRSHLEGEGFEVSVNTFSGDEGQGGMVNARDDGAGRSVVVIVSSEDGSTKAVISYNQGS